MNKLIFFLTLITSLNARFLDVAMFIDKNEEATDLATKSKIGPMTLELGVALCQHSSAIVTSASLLANINQIRKSNNLRTLGIKNLILKDDDWYIYKHRSGLLYLLLPKTYIDNLKTYNTPEFQVEAKKYQFFAPQEILMGFRINPNAGIFRKVSWNDLELEPTSYNAVNLEQWQGYDTKINKNSNWLEIFTKGTDNIFGLWNISLNGHGSYSRSVFNNPGYIPKSVKEDSDYFAIAGMSLDGYRTFIQFLTDRINTNFLHYITCYGGDVALALPYLTTLQNYKGNIRAFAKRPNFTIAAGALTSEAVWTNSEQSLVDCMQNTRGNGLLNYRLFFNDLKKFAPNAAKAVIYNNKELKEILLNVTDTSKHSHDPYGISGLPSVMFPNSEIFRAIPLDDKTVVISEVFLKKHLLAFQNNKLVAQAKPITLKNKEVILIYPAVIPVELEISDPTKKNAPAIVSMSLGMSLTKISSLKTNIPFNTFVNKSIGAINPVFNKYFFINRLTVVVSKNKTVTYKNVLILIKNDNDRRRCVVIYTAEDNNVYLINFPNETPTKVNIPVKDENNADIYFESNSPEINSIFDWQYLSKILTSPSSNTPPPTQPKPETASPTQTTQCTATTTTLNKFKTVTNTLAKQAKVILQFARANQKQKNKLKPQVQKIKASLKKANINIRNAQGQTPLMVNPSIAPILMVLDKKKAKNTVNAKDKKGKTVLQYLIASKYNGQAYLYKILKNAGVKATPNDIKAVRRKLKNKPKARDQIIKILRG